MKKKRYLPPSYFVSSIVIMAGFHFLFPISTVVKFPWHFLAVIPLAFGSVLNLVADSDFKKNRTTVKPFEESSVLLATGVFQKSRNPMYLGMVLILIGEAILLGSLSPYLIVLLFALLMQFIFIIPEEKALETKFGDDYLKYKKKVRQWI